MNVPLGLSVQQSEGFSAFIPHPFPPEGLLDVPHSLHLKAANAARLIGKLDGITHVLPDIDFFLQMFVKKDATSSAQIEGTQATIIDALEKESGTATEETDADDITHYSAALKYGLERLDHFPLCLRFIREVHSILMTQARATHHSAPGEFRSSQNWLGGTKPSDATFVPPPVPEMHNALADFEQFLNEKEMLALIQIGLMHAQFETIHPFLDGNGRTGRLLITFLLHHRKLLERPVLFLSAYFKKHQQLYYQKLDDYRHGRVANWVDFFLDGVIEVAEAAIEISKKIRQRRDQDMAKIQSLAKRESDSGVKVLSNLFGSPVVNTQTIIQWTGFTRAGAQHVINRFIELGILTATNEKATYNRAYRYSQYLDNFIE